MSKVKRAHYVPKCYLRNFSNNEKLYVYDKALDNSWGSNIDSISSEKYFYDIKLKDIYSKYSDVIDKDLTELPDDLDEQEIEKYFANTIETRYGKQLNNIIAKFKLTPLKNLLYNEIITEEEKYDFAVLLTFQIVRTREFREYMIDNKEVFTKQVFNIWADAQGKPELIDGFDFEFNRDFESVEHAIYLMDYDFIEKIAESIFKHIWLFTYNKTDISLYTSDNPIVKKSNVNHPYRSYNGYASKGIELMIPISHNIALSIYESSYFNRLIDYDRKFYGFLNEDNVKYFNSMQVNSSYRQIFCKKDDFQLAYEMCKENEKLKNIDYRRVKVR
jgi:hypothetical protein